MHSEKHKLICLWQVLRIELKSTCLLNVNRWGRGLMKDKVQGCPKVRGLLCQWRWKTVAGLDMSLENLPRRGKKFSLLSKKNGFRCKNFSVTDTSCNVSLFQLRQIRFGLSKFHLISLKSCEKRPSSSLQEICVWWNSCQDVPSLAKALVSRSDKFGLVARSSL